MDNCGDLYPTFRKRSWPASVHNERTAAIVSLTLSVLISAGHDLLAIRTRVVAQHTCMHMDATQSELGVYLRDVCLAKRG